MAFIDTLLPEFDRETGTTRRLLTRVPDGALGWQPHERSMTLGRLAAHLAHIPTWANHVVGGDSFDIAAGADTAKDAASVAELLVVFDRNVTAARARIVGRLDGELRVPWTLTRGDQALFTLPKIVVLRYFLFNHLIHHRGQLSVYLRMRDVPIPAIYGPSADEGAF